MHYDFPLLISYFYIHSACYNASDKVTIVIMCIYHTYAATRKERVLFKMTYISILILCNFAMQWVFLSKPKNLNLFHPTDLDF